MATGIFCECGQALKARWEVNSFIVESCSMCVDKYKRHAEGWEDDFKKLKYEIENECCAFEEENESLKSQLIDIFGITKLYELNFNTIHNW